MKLLLSLLTVAGLGVGLLVGLASRGRAPLPNGLRVVILVVLCAVAVALGWVLVTSHDFAPVLPPESAP
jgi:hypothetical protein